MELEIAVGAIVVVGVAAYLRLRVAHRQLVALQQQLAQAQKLESLGLLAGAVAHDFNNLLTAIRGYAEMLARDTTGRSAEHANEILKTADGGTSLTRQLLTFSHRGPPDTQPVDLSAVVHDISAMLGRLLGESIEFECESVPVVARVDMVGLRQVLLNLVVNARDAMPEGGVLRIVTRPVERDGRAYALIAVEDTGQGIERAVRERMFEPFFTTKPAGNGTGLGLSTVHGVVRQHGGFITVDSAPGEGTTFCVYLPVSGVPQPVTA